MKREHFNDKKRIVIKIGSSSLTHKNSHEINYRKLEQLARVLSDLRSQGKEVILVSSGAQAVGRKVMNLNEIPAQMSKKQALAAIGQAKLMMTYQRLFAEYHQIVAQVLMTKITMKSEETRTNAKNTFEELISMGVIPIVNENDTVATYEIEFGDNDHLSAFVTTLVDAQLLIILSDIDGFYTDDPSSNHDAKLITHVAKLNGEHFAMSKATSSSSMGKGGMSAKIDAARIVTEFGADMVLVNGHDVNIIHDVLEGKNVGTTFSSNKVEHFDVLSYFKGDV